MDNQNPQLVKLVRKITEGNAYCRVESRATLYPDFTKLYLPISPYSKLIPGMEPVKKQVKKSSREPNQEDNLERSLRRAKNKVKDYVLTNKFDLFVTFTFAKDRYDIEKCKRKMTSWLKNQRQRTGKFEYLLVPELHKDGALHFHALFKGFQGDLKRAKNPKTGNDLFKKGRAVYSLPSFRSGFTTVYKIENTPESHAKVGNYLLKYITKDMPLFHGKNRYQASRGLKLPLAIDNPPEWLTEKDWINVWSHKYGITIFIDNDDEILEYLKKWGQK